MSKQIIDALPQGILGWYDFGSEKNILCIGGSSLVDMLKEKGHSVNVIDEYGDSEYFCEQNRHYYDYIIAINVLSYEQCPEEKLDKWKCLLKETGTLLLALNNRLGLRFFCGDRDPFTNRSFDGIENYRQIVNGDEQKGRYYSKNEIEVFLHKSGFQYNKFYSVLPCIEFPQLIYAENYLPNEELNTRYFPKYHYPDSIFLEEKFLYKDIIENGMFHNLANSYLIECSLENQFTPVLHVTASMDRGRENALATIIKSNKVVEKKILYKEQKEKLKQLYQNTLDLKERGISVIEGKISDEDTYVMPYIEGENGVSYIRKLFFRDIEQFKEEVDRFINIIRSSSEHIQNHPELGSILERGYYDLVPLNALYSQGKYVFFDQEFCIEKLPVNVIIFRTICIIYTYDSMMDKILPRNYFYKKYGLEDSLDLLIQIEQDIYKELRKIDELGKFWSKYETNPVVISNNRQRINYTEEEYQKLFVDIFNNNADEEYVIFGSGNYAKQFLQIYKEDYKVSCVVDNNKERWGEYIEGIAIKNPSVLQREKQVKVVICIKNYASIVKQLNAMGIKNYGIYNPNISYKNKPLKIPEDIKQSVLYERGYIAGVFDLFHIGHLNLIKKAKEKCKYLIVGVVSDEGVRKYKKTETVIPQNERLEIVKSCKFVDEAFILPVDFADSITAHKLYDFDCQFSGSDYQYNPDWLKVQDKLRVLGADLVFLPYTETTSSTNLKKRIGAIY